MNKEEVLLSCVRQLDGEDRAELLEQVRSVYRQEISRKPTGNSGFQEVKEPQEV